MKFLYRVGVGKALARGAQRKGHFPVLLFHRVSPEPDPFWPPLHPEVFRELLRSFTAHYRFLPLERLLDSEPLPSDAAFISFDDAFRDVQEHALPVLEELGLPATIFVPAGSIDAGEAIWPSLLDRYMEAEWEGGSAVLELGEERIEWEGMKAEGKERAAGALKQRIMGAPYSTQMKVREKFEGRGLSKHIGPMDWKSLEALPEHIELGAHTLYHPYLPSIGEEEIEREMKGSKERIEEMTGRTVRSFAYPFGAFDERAMRIAAKHFEAAFTTEGEQGSPSMLRDPAQRMRIPRIDVLDREPEEAFLRVNGLHRKLRRMNPLS